MKLDKYMFLPKVILSPAQLKLLAKKAKKARTFAKETRYLMAKFIGRKQKTRKRLILQKTQIFG
jgi:hypothetical protein